MVALGVSCDKEEDTGPGTAPGDSEQPGDSVVEDTAPEVRWTGSVQVQVIDVEGNPVQDAIALTGGASERDWVYTAADGTAEVVVGDDGITDRWVLAGKEGYTSGGQDLDEHEAPTGQLQIVIYPLPAVEDDNPDYGIQPGGTSMSMDTSECGHCHPTIADDWAAAPHREAARNARTWDLYVGGSDLDAEACSALGGWLSDGQAPGVEGELLERCYTGQGVLPFLHEGCGEQGQQACDHPDLAGDLQAFGSCGDCHAPAVDGAMGGQVDLARATGVGYDEGVTCDLCHKVRSVEPGGAPGLDGAIQLQRPSEPTEVFSQDFDPITFGPYPDVVLAIMKGAYAPQMRESGWCSGCHEYARAGLRDDQQVDAERWPGGLPIIETYSECASCDIVTCQGCHMAVLDEESSTYDITERDLIPSVDQGWIRETGEVHHHDLAWVGGDSGMDLALELAENEGMLEAVVTVTNTSAGHAMPTGEPLRQLIVQLEAVDGKGQTVAALGGQAIPDVGGLQAWAVMDEGVQAQGTELVFDALDNGAVSGARFLRPTGQFDDYDGPGTASFEGRSAEEKGLPLYDFLAERAVVTVEGPVVQLDEAPPALQAGDLVYLVGDEDMAGAPGWLYAKILTDAQGERGVAHYRATDMASDNRLAAQASASSTHRFPLPSQGESLEVKARLLHRDYAAPVAQRYGWDRGDEELEQVSEVYAP